MPAPTPATVLVVFAPVPALPRQAARIVSPAAAVLAPEDLPHRKPTHPLVAACVEVGFCRPAHEFGPSAFNILFDD